MAEHTFKHSGPLGDIIYSLPCVRALAGGVLYLDVDGGKTDPFVIDQTFDGTTRFDRAGYDFLRPLLIEQPYLRDVKIWTGEAVDFNLNAIRTLAVDRKANLAGMYMRKFGLDESLSQSPWLSIKSPPIHLDKPYLINRTPRYVSKYATWEMNKKFWITQSIFVGLPIEHEIFEKTFDMPIEYRPVRDGLEIAQILAGSVQLIANQSFIMAVAIGMGVCYLQETYEHCPNCVFQRDNAQYF